MATSDSMPFTVALLSPDQLASLLAGLAGFPSTVRQEGQEYAASGRVGPIDYDGHTAGARVRGSLDYYTQWEWQADDWLAHCSCPDAPQCKHTYALGRAMLGSTRPSSAVASEPVPRLIPSPPVRSSARSVAAVPESPLERLRQTRDLRLRQDLLARLLQDAPRPLSAYEDELQPILREVDADLLCWRLAEFLARRLGGWVPAVLAPYRLREDLEKRFEQRTRNSLARDLVAWGNTRVESPKRELRVLVHLDRQPNGAPQLRLEARVSTTKLRDVRRTVPQLTQLRTDVRRAPSSLPVDQAILLEWLVDAQLGASDSNLYPGASGDPRPGLYGKYLQGFLARASGSSVVVWAKDSDPVLAALAGITPGERIRVDQIPVRLLPTCTGGAEDLRIDLAFHWPDGRERLLQEAVYFASPPSLGALQPSYVIADGVFQIVNEQPPEALVESFHRTKGLPVPAEERGEVLVALSEQFPHLQDTISRHTRFYPARAVIGIDLRDDDWMQVRVFAYTGEETWRPGEFSERDALRFELVPQRGWVLLDNESKPAGDGYAELPKRPSEVQPEASVEAPEVGSSDSSAGENWFVAPEPAGVRSALQWLESLRAHAGKQRTRSGATPGWADFAVGWWTHSGRRRMEEFAAAWDARPSDVEFFGTNRMLRLLTGEIRVAPRLRVQSSGIDWLSVTAEWMAEGRDLSEDDLAQLRVATTRFVKLSSGWVDRELVRMDESAVGFLADLGLEAGESEQHVSLWQLAGAKAESLDAMESYGVDPQIVAQARELRERVSRFEALRAIDTPEELRAELRPYQQRGLEFLSYVSSLGIGAVLADDMGLGKTVQALAWLLDLIKREPNGGPTLVVCPASVVHNWEREVQRFTPSLRILVLTSGPERHEMRRRIAEFDLVITNYSLLRLDIEEWKQVELRAVILDEAQNIKNPDAAVTQAALGLRAKYRLALTGTPLENRALDLWSIVSFVNPGYLGLRSRFQQRFDRPDAPLHVRTLLAAKLRPVMLRRSKRQVATDLPDRIEERQDCDLLREQRALYLSELRRSRELVHRLSGEPGGIAQNKLHILAALTRLRQICCHPALVGGARDAGSGKFEALFDLLEPILAEGHKVVVFSQFVECLKLLRQEVAVRGIGTHMLTGKSVKRDQIVDAFQNDPNPCVFFVSLKAGGTGLNLTAASYVILFDPWWNPAVEAQAIDRAHRIGQDKTVIAYRMLTKGTIEEKIFELQQRKSNLIRDLLGEGGLVRSLSREDLDYLLADV